MREALLGQLADAEALRHAMTSGQAEGAWEPAAATALTGLHAESTELSLALAGMANALKTFANSEFCPRFLGDESDMARQLAISTVPTYYLIGPDGNLAASSNEWSAIGEALGAAAGEVK